MKHILVFVILIFSAFGLNFAQTSNRQALPVPYTVTAEPKLPINYQGYSAEPAKRDSPASEVYIIPGPAKRIINGILGVSRGMITLTDKKGVAWYVLGLDRYIGFIDGLDLGEEVELEGYAPAAPGSSQERLFQATKLILDNMDYELIPIPEDSRSKVQPPVNYEPAPPPPVIVQMPKASSGKEPVSVFKNNKITVNTFTSAPAPVREHKHTSPWSPQNEPLWMQNLDLSVIWKENSNFWQDTADSSNFWQDTADNRNNFFD
ncbi:hypothetical protein AGMMS50255_1860 [Spirochaetia bacterium]|nr:hypothetical protein AGMMS50255_1860 [Spirochaetia bacterium]